MATFPSRRGPAELPPHLVAFTAADWIEADDATVPPPWTAEMLQRQRWHEARLAFAREAGWSLKRRNALYADVGATEPDPRLHTDDELRA